MHAEVGTAVANFSGTCSSGKGIIVSYMYTYSRCSETAHVYSDMYLYANINACILN